MVQQREAGEVNSLFLTLAEFLGMSPPLCCHYVLQGGHIAINSAKKQTVLRSSGPSAG